MICNCERYIEDNTKITSRACRSYCEIGKHEKSRIKHFRKLVRGNNEQEFSFTLIERERLADIQFETLSTLVLK